MQLLTPDNYFLFCLRILEFICYTRFFSSLQRRRKKLLFSIVLVLSFSFLSVLLRELISTYTGWRVEYIYITFIYYPLVLVFLLLYYRISLREGAYGILLIFLCVHALRFLSNQLLARALSGSLWLHILYLAFYTAALYATLTIVKIPVFKYPGRKIKWPHLLLMYIAVIPVFYIGNLGIWTSLDQSRLPISVALIGLICSYCGLAVVVGYDNTLALAEKKQELIRLETVLTSQQKQYQLKKETVDLLNHKYHDLKNHLLYLSSEKPDETRAAYIHELEMEIRAYDALQQTGNEALDVILTSKSLECTEKNIRLILFVDGSELAFLQPLDVVGIFGNALDNAMESVIKLPEEFREIMVRMSRKETWLTLRFENRYSITPVFDEQGWPYSTKRTDNSLGIGLKSIKNTIQKYHGHMQLLKQDDRFVLNILFPRT